MESVRVAGLMECLRIKNAHFSTESMDVTLSSRIPWLLCCYFKLISKNKGIYLQTAVGVPMSDECRPL
jgi:hypothetical protein